MPSTISPNGDSRKTTRRALLRGAALAALPLAAPGLLRRAFAAETLTFCEAVALSGSFAEIGRALQTGFQLGAKMAERRTGLACRALSLDSEGNAGKTIRLIQEQMQAGVRHFLAGTTSVEGVAASAEVAKGGGTLLTSIAAEEITGSHCNRATFRWSTPAWGVARETIRPMAAMFPTARRWYTITAKYVAGDDILSNARQVFAEMGIEHVGNSYHSLTETEFSGHLTSAAAAKPDVLYLINFAGQSNATLRQAMEFGLKRRIKVVLAWGMGLSQYQELGSEVLEDVYVGCQYDHSIDSPENKRMVEAFKGELGIYPGFTHVVTYHAWQVLALAAKKAGSTEPGAVIAALEGMPYEGPTGDEVYRAFDHQCLKNYYLLRGKAPKAKKFADDYLEVVSAGKSYLDQSHSLCKMG